MADGLPVPPEGAGVHAGHEDAGARHPAVVEHLLLELHQVVPHLPGLDVRAVPAEVGGALGVDDRRHAPAPLPVHVHVLAPAQGEPRLLWPAHQLVVIAAIRMVAHVIALGQGLAEEVDLLHVPRVAHGEVEHAGLEPELPAAHGKGHFESVHQGDAVRVVGVRLVKALPGGDLREILGIAVLRVDGPVVLWIGEIELDIGIDVEPPDQDGVRQGRPQVHGHAEDVLD